MAKSIALDADLLRAALIGYEQKLAELEATIAGIKKQIGGGGAPRKAAAVAPEGDKPAKKRRVMSPTARKRIADAQKKRWAAYHDKQKA